MSFKYEPSSEPLHNSAKELFLHRELTTQVLTTCDVLRADVHRLDAPFLCVSDTAVWHIMLTRGSVQHGMLTNRSVLHIILTRSVQHILLKRIAGADNVRRAARGRAPRRRPPPHPPPRQGAPEGFDMKRILNPEFLVINFTTKHDLY